MDTKYEIKFVGYNNSGQRRLVVKFTNLVNATDNKISEEYGLYQISYLKEMALKRAARIGGKRYKSKNFKGGIVFVSLPENELIKAIARVVKEREIEYIREPNPFELKVGEGAIHYITLPECLCLKSNGDIYKRMKCPYTGMNLKFNKIIEKEI